MALEEMHPSNGCEAAEAKSHADCRSGERIGSCHSCCHTCHLANRSSQWPPASRPHFTWLKPFRIEQRALPVAVAQLILVRCMKLFVFVFTFLLVACHSSSGTVQSVELIEYGTF